MYEFSQAFSPSKKKKLLFSLFAVYFAMFMKDCHRTEVVMGMMHLSGLVAILYGILYIRELSRPGLFGLFPVQHTGLDCQEEKKNENKTFVFLCTTTTTMCVFCEKTKTEMKLAK